MECSRCDATETVIDETSEINPDSHTYVVVSVFQAEIYSSHSVVRVFLVLPKQLIDNLEST